MNSRVAVLCLIVVTGCDQAPNTDSPFQHLERIVQTTKEWLGIRRATKQPDALHAHELDRHQGRLRRRMDWIRSEGVVQDHHRSQMRREIGREQFTKGIHVGAIVLWSKERPKNAIGVAIYSRDGMGWKGEPCDYLRIKMQGEQDFDRLLAELE